MAKGAIGERLQAARDKLGLSQQQCAERLFVEARVITALEAEDFASLGGSVYARGHLRRYASLLGENATDFEQLMLGSPGTTAPPDIAGIATRPLTQPARTPRIGIWPVALLAIALALAALVRWAATTTFHTNTGSVTVPVPLEPPPPPVTKPPGTSDVPK